LYIKFDDIVTQSFIVNYFGNMSAGIHIPEWRIQNIAVPVERLRVLRRRDYRIWADEAAKRRVVGAGVVKVQADGRVLDLPGEAPRGGRGPGGEVRSTPRMIAQFRDFAAAVVGRNGLNELVLWMHFNHLRFPLPSFPVIKAYNRSGTGPTKHIMNNPKICIKTRLRSYSLKNHVCAKGAAIQISIPIRRAKMYAIASIRFLSFIS